MLKERHGDKPLKGWVRWCLWEHIPCEESKERKRDGTCFEEYANQSWSEGKRDGSNPKIKNRIRWKLPKYMNKRWNTCKII